MTTSALLTTDRDTPAGVLGALRTSRETARRAEVEIMVAALDWADMHSADSIDDAATVPGTDRGLALAGEGAPSVAEFAIVELAAALGRSADSTRLWLGATLEIRHRLPLTWHRLEHGSLEPWRARQIAAQTMLLGREAAGWVDGQVAPVAHKIGPTQLERVTTEAVRRYDPEQAYTDELTATERRHVTLHDQHVTDGCVEVTATLDVVDARDLNTAVGKAAHDLLLAGSTDSVDVRRAQALGEIARHELTLDLGADEGPERGSTVYVHLDAQTLDLLEDETGADQPTALVEKAGSVRDVTVGIDRLRTWLTRPGTSVTIRPVIDLNATIECRGYQPSATLREQIVLRNRRCVFPHCTRAARSADLDHIEPYGPDESGKPTSSENLAPLCRLHHRAKTHDRWSYTQLAPGEFLWRSPHDQTFLVDPTGTTDLGPADPPPREPDRP